MADCRLLEIAENRYKDLFDSEESLEQMSRRVFVYTESTSASLLRRLVTEYLGDGTKLLNYHNFRIYLLY